MTRNLKSTLSFLCLMCLCAFTSVSAQVQVPSEKPTEAVIEKGQAIKSGTTKAPVQIKAKSPESQSTAVLKSVTPEVAEKKKNEVNTKISKGQSTLSQARIKIAAKRKTIEGQMRSGEITQKEYQDEMAKIKEAELQMRNVNKLITENRKLIKD